MITASNIESCHSPHVLGYAVRSMCFRSTKIHGLETLGAFWRNNGNAWMQHGIMIEYLRRPTLLLMDNFSAHELAAKKLADGSPEPLRHKRVMWLPANATSVHQPLDQGIIQNWKCYVRKKFVRHMVTTFDVGGNPTTSMDVLRAIRWGIHAWEFDVTKSTIQNCWARSQAFDFGSQPRLEGNMWSDSKALLKEVAHDVATSQNAGHIKEAMDMRNSINPAGEDVVDRSEDITADILARYIEPERLAEWDEEVEEAPTVKISEALTALSTLKLYEEQSSEANPALTKLLRKHERELLHRRKEGQQQRDIRGFYRVSLGGGGLGGQND